MINKRQAEMKLKLIEDFVLNKSEAKDELFSFDLIDLANGHLPSTNDDWNVIKYNIVNNPSSSIYNLYIIRYKDDLSIVPTYYLYSDDNDTFNLVKISNDHDYKLVKDIIKYISKKF